MTHPLLTTISKYFLMYVAFFALLVMSIEAQKLNFEKTDSLFFLWLVLLYVIPKKLFPFYCPEDLCL